MHAVYFSEELHIGIYVIFYDVISLPEQPMPVLLRTRQVLHYQTAQRLLLDDFEVYLAIGLAGDSHAGDGLLDHGLSFLLRKLLKSDLEQLGVLVGEYSTVGHYSVDELAESVEIGLLHDGIDLNGAVIVDLAIVLLYALQEVYPQVGFVLELLEEFVEFFYPLAVDGCGEKTQHVDYS